MRKILTYMFLLPALAACNGNDSNQLSSASFAVSSTNSSVSQTASSHGASSFSSVLSNSSVSHLVLGSSSAVAVVPSSSAAVSSAPSATTTTLIIEEGELGYCDSYSVPVETEHGGFEGAGYANPENATGEGLAWRIKTDVAGDTVIHLRYALGAIAARPGTLSINGGVSGQYLLAFDVTGSWTGWQTESLSIYLEAGVNDLQLVANSADGLANIDSLALVGAAISPVNCAEPEPEKPAFDMVGFATENGGTTGGEGGQVVTVSNYSELKKYAESTTPYVIHIVGTISNGSGGGQVRVAANKSLLGVGSAAFLSGVGLDIKANNIIVRNLKMTLVGTDTPANINGGDLIGISASAKNIWIDHCEFYSEDPNVQPDKDKYDGLVDIKGQTGFITLSWNYFHDHHKGGLVGAADDDLYDDRKVTMHHNYYNKVKLRVPMYRGATGHFFNNYIVGATDATEIRANTCVRVEKNYYESLHYSIYTPSDAPGKAERIDNIEISRTARAYPSNCSANIPYNYANVLTNSTEDVKTLVPKFAGVGKL